MSKIGLSNCATLKIKYTIKKNSGGIPGTQNLDFEVKEVNLKNEIERKKIFKNIFFFGLNFEFFTHNIC